MANNRATKSGFAAEAQRKVSTVPPPSIFVLFKIIRTYIYVLITRMDTLCLKFDGTHLIYTYNY